MKTVISGMVLFSFFVIGCAKNHTQSSFEKKAEVTKNIQKINVNKKSLLKRESRIIIGQTALIRVAELDMHFLARIDTGATLTSLNAFNIKVIESSEKEFILLKKSDNPKKISFSDTTIKNNTYKKYIGKKIYFDTFNEKGKLIRVQSEIVDVQRVKNAQGAEYRYVVLLTLEYKGIMEKYRVNLRDRRHMTYKLLIGRNWLSKHFLVNVNQNEGLLTPIK